MGARLSAKVGPLPVWAWAVVLLGAYYLYTKYQGSSTAATGTTPASATPIPLGDQSGGGVGSASGSSGTTTPTPTTGETTPASVQQPMTSVQQPMTDNLAGAISPERTSAGLGTSLGSFYSPGLGTPATGGSVKVAGGRLTQ